MAKNHSCLGGEADVNALFRAPQPVGASLEREESLEATYRHLPPAIQERLEGEGCPYDTH